MKLQGLRTCTTMIGSEGGRAVQGEGLAPHKKSAHKPYFAPQHQHAYTLMLAKPATHRNCLLAQGPAVILGSALLRMVVPGLEAVIWQGLALSSSP